MATFLVKFWAKNLQIWQFFQNHLVTLVLLGCVMQANVWDQKIKHHELSCTYMGSGSGKVVTSYNRGPWFESSHQQMNLLPTSLKR